VPAEVREDRLPLAALCLDPNNPRYADLDVSKKVPDERIHEQGTQETALTRMIDGPFDIEQLKQSIVNIGFIEVDRLVVVPLSADDRFVVIEGNRRVAALLSLKADEAAGEAVLSASLQQQLMSLPVLVIDRGTADERDALARVIQGLRHTAGIKPWGAYQQAQFVGLMLSLGDSILDIKATLGMSAQRVNSLRRVHLAMEQMKDDEEFGEFAKPHLFSNIEEALKQPRVREWLDWDDEPGRMLNAQHRTYLYEWMVGEEGEDGNRLPPKVIDAKDLRLLPRLFDSPPALQRLIDEPNLSLRAAAQMVPTPEPAVDWRAALVTLTSKLGQIPALDLASATPNDVELLETVRQLANTLLDHVQVTPTPDHADTAAE
jgi:hypothetical protein